MLAKYVGLCQKKISVNNNANARNVDAKTVTQFSLSFQSC